MMLCKKVRLFKMKIKISDKMKKSKKFNVTYHSLFNKWIKKARIFLREKFNIRKKASYHKKSNKKD